MRQVDHDNSSLLALYGISLKKENKASSVLQLKNMNEDIKMSRSLYDCMISAAKNRNIHYVKLPKISFGIELEFVGSRAPEDLAKFNMEMYKLLREKYFYSGAYTHNDGTSWILGKDSSIHYELCNNLVMPYGYELSSPKLELFNKDHIELLSKVIELVKTHLHAEVNKSCGTHIHIGFKRDRTMRGSIHDLLSVYSYMESKVFDPIVPKTRRRNRFCGKTQSWLRGKYQKLSSRYCEFNYDGECKSLHFEFRQLEGTLDLDTILYWSVLQTYVLYDLLDNINNDVYRATLASMNIFEVLFHYNFDSDLINFFINRAIEFKSRTIQS